MDAWRAATGPDPDQVTLRRQVLRVLAQHPAGLTPGEIASQLGLTTSLARVLRAMAHAGLVQRVTAERYRRLSP
jgi:DNA-binding IclR family transcriptional regulator